MALAGPTVAAAVASGSTAATGGKAAFSIGNIIAATSAFTGMVGQIRAGQAAAVQAAFQARIFEQQAAFTRQRSARQEAVFRRDIRRFRGTQRSLLAKGGAKLEEGSPLLLQVETAGQAELEALTIRAGGDITSARLRQRAILTRMAGSSARTAGFVGAGASLLTGVSTIAENLS